MDGLPRPAPEIGAPRGVEGLERRDAVAAAPRVRQRDGEAVDVGRELADEAVARREEEEVVEHRARVGSRVGFGHVLEDLVVVAAAVELVAVDVLVGHLRAWPSPRENRVGVLFGRDLAATHGEEKDAFSTPPVARTGTPNAFVRCASATICGSSVARNTARKPCASTMARARAA